MKLILPTLAAMLMLASCTTYTSKCQNEGLVFRLIGFGKADAAVVDVMETGYQGGIRETKSYTFQADSSWQTGVGPDTLILPYSGPNYFIYGDDDSVRIELYFRALNKRVLVTDVVHEPPREEKKKVPFFVSLKLDDCYNKILSYKLDGVVVQPQTDAQYRFNIDIRK